MAEKAKPPRPDAVRFAASGFLRAEFADAAKPVAERAQDLLKVDRDEGERAWCRTHGDEIFATRDPLASIFYPKASDQRGKSRYTWEDQGNGVLFGTLKQGAEAQADPEAVPVRGGVA